MCASHVDKTHLAEKIAGMVASELRLPDAPSESASLKLLGMDSVHIVSFILLLEEQFEIEFDDDELHLRHFASLKSIVDLVDQKIRQADMLRVSPIHL